MSETVIRKTDTRLAGHVRSLNLDPTPPGPVTPDTVEPQDDITRELIKLRTMLAAADAEYERKISAAREQGRLSAVAGFQRDEARTLEILAEGVRAATDLVRSEIVEMQNLAIALCQNVLSKVLSDPERQQEYIAGAIAKQLELVRRDSVLSVRVSKLDFPAADSLADLSTRLGLTTDAIQTDPAITAGSCRMLMRLGHVDLSIPGYLQEVRKMLEELHAANGGGT